MAYSNPDPELATLVLEELLNRYFTKHLEVHRSAGAFDFVTQQTDQVRARLNETEDALKALKAKAGIVSYADSTKALSAALAEAGDELAKAEMAASAQRARVKRMEEAGGSASDNLQRNVVAWFHQRRPPTLPGDRGQARPTAPGRAGFALQVHF